MIDAWTRQRMALLVGVAGMIVAGCRAPAAPPTAVVRPASAPEAAPEPPAPAFVAAPHRYRIASLRVDARGPVAVTRDALGQARFWPALDGSAPPLRIDANDVEDVDLMRLDDRWRVVASGGGQTRGFEFDGLKVAPLGPALAGAFGRTLADGRIALVRGGALVVARSDGAVSARIVLPGPVHNVFAADDRSAVVVVTGDFTDAFELDSSSNYEDFGVFAGELTRVALDDAGGVFVSSPVEFVGTEVPTSNRFAVGPKAARVAYRVGEPWSDGSIDVEEADLLDGIRRVLPNPEDVEQRFHYDAKGRLVLEPSGTGREPADDERQYAGDLRVEVDGWWLRVHGPEWTRALGAPRFGYQFVGWAPDGERLVWARSHAEDIDADSEHPAITLQFTDAAGNNLPSPRREPLPFGLVDAVWPHDSSLMLLYGNGGVQRLDLATGATLPLSPGLDSSDGIDGSAVQYRRVEHDWSSRVSLLVGDGRDPTVPRAFLVPWSTGIAEAVSLAEGVVVDELGLVVGGNGDVWALGPKGLANLERGAGFSSPLEPQFSALSDSPLGVFDVLSFADGRRILDWGDRWEVVREAKATSWPRDVPVFGPLSVSPDGRVVLAQPECGSRSAAVHPLGAEGPQAAASWVFQVGARAPTMRWSPDGTRLAVLGDRDAPGEVFDVQRRRSLFQQRPDEFQVLEVAAGGELETPKLGAPTIGRCYVPSRDDW